MAGTPAGKATGQERVHARLRADILGGDLRPGERLPFAVLAARYDASAGVIREAMSRLVEQGLVTSESQRGFRVVTVSRDDLQQLTEARVLVESATLRSAVAHGDLAWESRLLAAHHRLERTPMLGAGGAPHLDEPWALAHLAFHAELLAGSPNVRLQAIAANLRDNAELYRRWSVTYAPDGDRDVAGEHRAILEATLARDADAAARLLAEHVERTTALLLASDGVVADGATGRDAVG